MNNEKILSDIYTLKYFAENDCVNAILKKLDEMEDEIKEEIRSSCQKKKGLAKRDNLIKKLLKNASPAKMYCKSYSPCDDMFGFIDGYRAYVLKDNFGYESILNFCSEPFNIKALKSKECDIRVDIDLNDLKVFIAEEKAKKKVERRSHYHPYIIENDKIKIAFNPVWLLEFCDMFGCDYLMCKDCLSPAQYESENGEWGVLLPVRIRE